MFSKYDYISLFFIPLLVLGKIPFASSQNSDPGYGNTPSDSLMYIEVVINEKIIEAFKVSQKNMEAINELYEITSFDIESLIDAYQEYIEWTADADKNYIADGIEGIPESVDTLLTTKEGAIENEPGASKNAANIIKPFENDNLPDVSGTVEAATGSQLVFRVQIAAGKSFLDSKTLKAKYNGSRDIKMVKEEGWYKYYIADCPTMKEAILVKKESRVDDAFIVAYKDGKRTNYTLQYKAIPKSNSTVAALNNITALSNDITIYVVQIAALLSSASPGELKKIYAGNENLNIIEEGGWFKYSIGSFNNRKDANKLRKDIDVQDAFVVGYRNGKKLDGSDTRKKDILNDKNIIFVIQIAASREAISESRLQQICKGREKTDIRKEEGWFKYSIGNYKSFSEAKIVLKDCGVSDAFIVAYQNKKKINLSKAIRLMK